MVEDLSGGRIQVKLFPGGVLGKTKEAYDYLVKGLADVDLIIPIYHPGVFPLTDVMTLPFGVPGTSYVGSAVLQGLYDQYLYEEYKDIHVLNIWQSTGYVIVSREKPVLSPADAKGLIIRTSGGMQTDVVESWGANDVAVPIAESYEALKRGTVDGLMHTSASINSYKLQEVTSYMTDLGLPGAVGIWAVNKDFYNKLPRDLQIILDYAGKHMGQWTSGSYYGGGIKAMKAFKDAGMNMHTPTSSEVTAFAAPNTYLWEDWAKKIDAKGLPGTEVMEAFKAELAKYGIYR